MIVVIIFIMKLIVMGIVVCFIIVKGEMSVIPDVMIIIVVIGEIVCVSVVVKCIGIIIIIAGICSLVVIFGIRLVNDINGVLLELIIMV